MSLSLFVVSQYTTLFIDK